VTLDINTKQVVSVACSCAVALLQRAPAHWIGPGQLFDTHTNEDARGTGIWRRPRARPAAATR
jgi:hypothetical protein